MQPQTRLLITGAAGKIGSFLAARARGAYALSLADIREPAEAHGAPFAALDLGDLAGLERACAGADVVVHLAADPSVRAAWESLLPNNIVGAYHVFEAARRAGCRRVVFASSINATGGYPREVQLRADMPPRPANLYGASKAWGETLARLYADQHGLSGICLRFGAVSAREDVAAGRIDPALLDIVLTLDDCARLILAAVEAPESLRFGIYHGVSDNRYKRMDISGARADLGYAPQDDAFQLAGLRDIPHR